jgi:hypothetical protein
MEPEDEALDLAELAGSIGDMADSLESVREAEWAETMVPDPERIPFLAPDLEKVSLTSEEIADRAHTKEVREVMRVLTQLPRGLPTALGGKDLTALAREIVEAPDGCVLVEIDGHWYHADPGNTGKFLTEWREDNGSANGDADERLKRLDQLEQALLEGKISEGTYNELRRKYEG